MMQMLREGQRMAIYPLFDSPDLFLLAMAVVAGLAFTPHRLQDVISMNL